MSRLTCMRLAPVRAEIRIARVRGLGEIRFWSGTLVEMPASLYRIYQPYITPFTLYLYFNVQQKRPSHYIKSDKHKKRFTTSNTYFSKHVNVSDACFIVLVFANVEVKQLGPRMYKSSINW